MTAESFAQKCIYRSFTPTTLILSILYVVFGSWLCLEIELILPVENV